MICIIILELIFSLLLSLIIRTRKTNINRDKFFYLLLSTIGTYFSFHRVSIDVGSDRDMQYGSPSDLNDRTRVHVASSSPARKSYPERKSLTFTSQPVSSIAPKKPGRRVRRPLLMPEARLLREDRHFR